MDEVNQIAVNIGLGKCIIHIQGNTVAVDLAVCLGGDCVSQAGGRIVDICIIQHARCNIQRRAFIHGAARIVGHNGGFIDRRNGDGKGLRHWHCTVCPAIFNCDIEALGEIL